MKKLLGTYAAIVFIGAFVLLQSSVNAQTTVPNGVTSVYGVSSYSDTDLNKQYYVQLYTDSPLIETFVVRFQHSIEGSESWSTIGSTRTIGSIEYYGSKNVRRASFSPSEMGLKSGVKYRFRAVIYESVAATDGGTGKKAYYDGNIVFTQTSDSKSATEVKPPQVTADSHWSPTIKSQTIKATVSDEVGISSMEVFVDERSIGQCAISGPRFVYCQKEYKGSVGSTHTYYVKVVSKSGLSTQSAKKSFTISSLTADDTKITVVQPDIVMFGYDACISCIDSGRGYNTNTQSCGASVSSSSSNGVSITSGKWVVHKRSTEVTQAGERSCEGVFVDEIRAAQGLPLTGGDNFHVLYKSNGYTIITEAKASGSNLQGCEVCFKSEGMGFNTDTQKCEKGSVQSSESKLAGVTMGNWVGLLTEAAKQEFVKMSGGYSSIITCEKYSGKAQTGKVTVTKSQDILESPKVNTSPIVSTTPSSSVTPVFFGPPSLKSCLACIKFSSYGYITTNGKCELGFPTKSKESSASVALGNWAWFNTKSLRDLYVKARPDTYAGALSCEEKFPEEVVYDTPAAPKNGTSTSMSSCLACVKQANRGYVSTTGRCEAGKSAGSSESSASVSSGNWVYFSSDSIMESVVKARPDLYSRGLSCEKMKSVVSGNVTTTSQNEVASPNQPSIESCMACMRLANKGYSWSTGRCELGNPLFSSESSASVLNRNWIYYTNDAVMNVVVSLKPDLYPRGLSCEFMNIMQKSANQSAVSSCSSWTLCSTCTQGATDACGWDKSTNTCKEGTDQGSGDGSAALSKNNWIWYATENDRASKPGMSC